MIILHDLPERERPVFLQAYEDAVDAAHDPAGFKRLSRLLDRWSVRVRVLHKVLVENPNYYEELDARRESLRNGTAPTVPIEEIFPDWQETLSRRHG